MANLPVVRSKEQMIGELVDGFLARVEGIDDLTRGSVLNQFFNAIAQSNFKVAASIINMIDALSVDRAAGEALQRLAKDRDVPILPGTASSGKIKITDLSFQKISSNVFAGQPAPVAGSLTVYAVDISDFNATGNIYIGRGTPNVEGPLKYTSIQTEGGGAYWSITLDPTTPTTKFHNVGEEIVMSQGGNRIIPVGSGVSTPTGSAITSVSFKTTGKATIIDGETVVDDVSIVCDSIGEKGNVPRGSITTTNSFGFDSSSFNNNALTNGAEPDTDDDIKDRIKRYEAAKSKGTEDAIRVSAIGITSPDELKTVKSSNILNFTDTSAALIFDDGTGYEPIYTGVGIEQIVDEALGGEKEIQLRNKPVAIARADTLNVSPYPMDQFSYLDVEIQGITLTHTFDPDSFRVPSNGTASEIAASINGNPNIHFSAYTAENGTKVSIFPRDKNFNDITVKRRSIDDANDILGFPVNTQYSLLLYKNDELLLQDGVYATIPTRIKSSWATSITSGDTLKYIVDGTPEQEIIFTNEDFQDIERTATVNSFTDIEVWVEVMNNLMTGVVASINGEQIDLTSARGQNNRATMEVTGGTLKDKMFSTTVSLSADGRASDYTFNKQTAQISLNEPLEVGDQVSAGSTFTRAHFSTTQIPDGPAEDGNLWMIVDGATSSVSSGVEGNTYITFSKVGTKITITAEDSSGDPIAFDSVNERDWLLLWSETDDLTNYPTLYGYTGFWRVESVQRGQIVVDDGNITRPAGSTEIIPTDRIVFTRSDAPMQKLSFSVGTLSNFVEEIIENLSGVDAEIRGSTIRVSTLSSDNNGEIALIAADSQGKSLGVDVGTFYRNIPSQNAFIVTEDSEAGMPSFSYSSLGTAISDTRFLESSYEEIGGTEFDFLEMLDKIDVTGSSQNIEPDSNKSRRILATNYNETTTELDLLPRSFLKSGSSLLQAGDRYFLRSSYQFDSEDTTTVIIDGDTATKTYTLPISRKMEISSNSTPTTSDFSVTDKESSLDLNDPSSFNGFDFSNFKVWRQSSTILTDSNYSIRMKSVDFGPKGDNIRIGLVYPKNNDQTAISHEVSNSDVIDVGIVLPVATPRTPNWDGTTSFTTDVTNIGTGKDRVKYTWRIGTEPNFLTGGADVALGDIAMINSSANFLSQNRDLFAKIVDVTTNTFSIELPAGKTVNDNVEFNSIVNQNGIITIISSTPHNITQGQKIGIWDTQAVSGTNTPMDNTYFPTVIGTNTFTVQTPTNVPGEEIDSATHSSDVITVNSPSHGLYEGNVILISDVGSGSYDGLAVVRNKNSADQFTYIRQGSSAPISGAGRFDFQSMAADSSVGITSASISASTLEVVCSSNHNFSAGNVVDIAGVIPDTWLIGSSYPVGQVVEYGGFNYISLVSANVGNQPDIQPSKWAIYDIPLDGKYIIDTIVNATTFSVIFEDISIIVSSSSGGTATEFKSHGKMARSLGANEDMLQFGEVLTTAQEIVDYVSQSASELFAANIQAPSTGSEQITESTEDLDLASNYLSGAVSEVIRLKGSRTVLLTVNANILAGSTVLIDAGTMSQYNGYYVVGKTKEIVAGTTWQITVQSTEFSSVSDTTVVTGTFLGSTPYLMMADGGNSVLSQNLGALAGSPMFTMKNSWSTVPEIGDEVRFLTINTDQVTRFWNRLVVTGLSNVAKISNSEYQRQAQIATNTFGFSGSIQVTGGSANSGNIAIVGSASEINDKIGVFRIPYELRSGVIKDGWLKVNQTVRGNKQIELDGTTEITVYPDGIGITSGSGLFQTERATTQDDTTQFKVERHGKYIAFINVDGQDLGLDVGGVKEGDWVRINNNNATAYDILQSYNIGDRVNYQGFNWYAVAASPNTDPVKPIPDNEWDVDTEYAVGDTVSYNKKAYRANTISIGSYPNTSPFEWDLVWEIREWTAGNQGIYQVVRTFGSNAFWIENEEAIEEMCWLGDSNNIHFYSYDSIMPGDTLVISGSILGKANVGRYVVRDEDYNSSYSFPAPYRIYTDSIPISSSGGILLGDSYVNVNIEEETPIKLWKKVSAIGPASSDLALVIVDSPNLMNKITSSNGGYIEIQNKLSYDTVPTFGTDAYKYFQGLIKELNKVVYGDSTQPLKYKGVRAAGTAIDIQAAIIKKITLALSIRVKTGIPFSSVRDSVKAAVAGYINGLGVSEQVALSKVVEAASKVFGVTSVVVSYPEYDEGNDLIPVSSQEKPLVADPLNDITVSILGT